MKVLVDMDGVVADFVGAVIAGLAEHGVRIDRTKINHFTYLDWASEYVDWAKEVAQADGFFLDLEPLPGAVEGVDKLAEHYEIRFCSSPLAGNKTCESDKRKWIARHFNQELADDAYIGTDKTLCAGDILIDDNPVVKGAKEPSWQHIVFDQSWNYASKSPRIFRLDDLGTVKKCLNNKHRT